MTEQQEKTLKEVVNAHSRDIKKLVEVISDLKMRLNKVETKLNIIELEKNRKPNPGDMFKDMFK